MLAAAFVIIIVGGGFRLGRCYADGLFDFWGRGEGSVTILSSYQLAYQ